MRFAGVHAISDTPLCPKQVTCKYLLDVLAYKITTQHTLLHDDMVKQMNR